MGHTSDTTHTYTCDLHGGEMSKDELLTLKGENGETIDVCTPCQRDKPIAEIPRYWRNQGAV